MNKRSGLLRSLSFRISVGNRHVYIIFSMASLHTHIEDVSGRLKNPLAGICCYTLAVSAGIPVFGRM